MTVSFFAVSHFLTTVTLLYCIKASIVMWTYFIQLIRTSKTYCMKQFSYISTFLY